MRVAIAVLGLLSLAPIACATALENDGTSSDSGHGDAHGDVGVGGDSSADSATSGDTHDGAIGDGGIDTAIPPSDTSSVDSGIPIDSTTIDTGVDTGHDTAPDVVVIDAPIDGGTSVEFPSATSTTYDTAGGGSSTLGVGGGGRFYVTGTYCEQAFPHAASVSRLDMNFRMSDLTSGCSTGATLSWNVKVNGTVVGSYSFVSGATGFGDRTIVESYTFAPVAAVGGNVTLRIEATSTVCPGGSSWDWYPGGTATME
jgi:hypothetical protein